MFSSEPVARMKPASLMAALTRSPEYLGPVQEWYEGIAAGAQGAECLAFLAAEGAFLLRYLGLMKLDQTTWQEISAEVASLLPDASAE